MSAISDSVQGCGFPLLGWKWSQPMPTWLDLLGYSPLPMRRVFRLTKKLAVRETTEENCKAHGPSWQWKWKPTSSICCSTMTWRLGKGRELPLGHQGQQPAGCRMWGSWCVQGIRSWCSQSLACSRSAICRGDCAWGWQAGVSGIHNSWQLPEI